MATNTNFDTLVLVNDGIVLNFKEEAKKEISFSELDRVYIKMYKLKPIYEFLLILFPFLLVFLSIQYVVLENLVFVALFAVVPVFVKTYKYKRYGLIIALKDGKIFRKRVSLKLKSENIAIVNAVKNKQLDYDRKQKD